MKINYSFIRAIFALIIGLVLVCAPEDSTRYIVMTIGVLFLVPGIIVLTGYFAGKNNNSTASPKKGKLLFLLKDFQSKVWVAYF